LDSRPPSSVPFFFPLSHCGVFHLGGQIGKRIGGVLCYAHPGILQDLLLHRLFFCSITDRDCVTRRPSTSHLYRNVGVDFTSSSPTLRHGEMAGTLGGACLRRRLHCRLVRTSTFAGSSSPSSIGTPSPTSPTVVSPHATRSDQPMCVIHPAPVTSVLVERAVSAPLTASPTSSSTRRCASRAWSSSSCTSSSPSLSSAAAASSGLFGLVLENLGSSPRFV